MEKIKLDEPIKIDGILVHELTMRRPKVRDMLSIAKSDTTDSEKEVRLISNLCEVSIEALKEMDMRDYMKVQDKLKDFLRHAPGEDCPPGGK